MDLKKSLFEKALLSQKEPGVQQMTTTMFEKIRQEGVEQGLQQGQKKIILRLLELRFGTLSSKVKVRVDSAPEEEIQDWLIAYNRGDSLVQMGLEEKGT